MPPLPTSFVTADIVKTAVSRSPRIARVVRESSVKQCTRPHHVQVAVVPLQRSSRRCLPQTQPSTQPSTKKLPRGAITADKLRYSTQAAASSPPPIIHDLFDKNTGSWQYIVADPLTHKAAIIDPVLDYDAASATISTTSADTLFKEVEKKGYQVDRILETHAHADHLTAASYLRERLFQTQGYAPAIGIGSRIKEVQERFRERYSMDPKAFEGGFDQYFEDDETFHVGEMPAKAIHLPGHTPDHMGYKIGDNVFVGDSIFHADLGSARADFPGGSAEALFASGRKLLSMPEHVKIWIGHDYPGENRKTPESCMTVGEHRRKNKHLNDTMEEMEFLQMRKKRDKTLTEPKLLHQSLQLNLRAGRLPESSEAGYRMISTPLKMKTAEW